MSAPTVDTAKTHLQFINGHSDVFILIFELNVTVVLYRTVVERLLRIIKRRCKERFVRRNHQSVAAYIDLLPPADIAFGTGFLRAQIVVELLICILVEQNQ